MFNQRETICKPIGKQNFRKATRPELFNPSTSELSLHRILKPVAKVVAVDNPAETSLDVKGL
jgi:hypothetical protein